MVQFWKSFSLFPELADSGSMPLSLQPAKSYCLLIKPNSFVSPVDEFELNQLFVESLFKTSLFLLVTFNHRLHLSHFTLQNREQVLGLLEFIFSTFQHFPRFLQLELQLIDFVISFVGWNCTNLKLSLFYKLRLTSNINLRAFGVLFEAAEAILGLVGTPFWIGTIQTLPLAFALSLGTRLISLVRLVSLCKLNVVIS